MFPRTFGCTTWKICVGARGPRASLHSPNKRQTAYSRFSRDEQSMVRFQLPEGEIVNRLLARSPPLSIEDIGSVHFRLRRPGERATTHLIRADIKMDGATIFISLNLADDGWPFLIENDSSYTVALCQIVGREAKTQCLRAHLHLGRHSFQCRVR